MPLFASYANSKQLDGFNASKLRSLIFDISMQASAPSENGEAVGISGVGWERNAQGKLGPRQVDLSSVMDPLILAEDSVDLNLRLMKWRVMPDLDLQSVQQQRCLLLGAGTLGCVVARTLLSWGVRKITLVDSGKVSFSNPVRQWLYNFDDCLQGGQPKALAAAASLRKIFPGANTEGVELSIPMPGHAAAAAADQTNRLHNDYNALVELIDSHDIIFLLTDSRESRWLPTMLAQHRGKLTINTALGFDSYLVMRHGMQAGGDSRLSCYFCADVVAPIDSMTDRTLDQQCTVSRPGLAPIAGALAVELLASLCQHPLGACAPAPSEDSTSQAQRGCLGVVPHQIRGSLSTFSSRLLTGPAFDRCIACSAAIMDAFNSHGFEFVMRALVAPTYLEDLTGLTELKKAAEEYSVDWEEADD
jgi:ubiquitin-like modifier-activating enzyme ATG7